MHPDADEGDARRERAMQMARHSAALLCVLYHAVPAHAFVAPGALAPGRPALQVRPARGRGQSLSLGCVRALCRRTDTASAGRRAVAPWLA